MKEDFEENIKDDEAGSEDVMTADGQEDAADVAGVESAAGEDAGSGKVSSVEDFMEKDGVGRRSNVSLFQILGGDILSADWLRRQIGVILLCVFFIVVYITNRYSAEHEIIEIDALKRELTEMRYFALTRSGELTVKTRQSQIEEKLRDTPDSVLLKSKVPPFLIKSQKEE